jgi:regulator of nucleoside diphosphate kinase
VTVCYPFDAEPERGFVSVLSPIGAALVGMRVGEVCRWCVNGQERSAQVAAILFQPEASGDYTT